MSIVLVLTIGIVDTDLQSMFIFMGMTKVGLSFVKYIPQVMLNIQRHSTKGLSIHSIW